MKFKIGDRVICKPGYVVGDSYGHTNLKHGGYGYHPDKVFVIGEITDIDSIIHKVLWPDDGSSGIYSNTVELYPPLKLNMEIKRFNFV